MSIHWERDRRAIVFADIHDASVDAVGDAAEHLLTTANLTVPHDEGTLERSGEVTQDGTEAAISYDTPYAARQHEELEWKHPGKGRAKWLELTLQEQAAVVGEFLAAQIRAEIG